MLKELSHIHREIARFMLEGKKIPEIALKMQMNPDSVRNITRDDLFRAHLAKLSDEKDISVIALRKEVMQHAPKAIKKLGELLDSKSESIMLKTTLAILDRSGCSAIQQGQFSHVILTPEKIEEMKRSAVRSGVDLGPKYRGEKTINPNEDNHDLPKGSSETHKINLRATSDLEPISTRTLNDDSRN